MSLLRWATRVCALKNRHWGAWQRSYAHWQTVKTLWRNP